MTEINKQNITDMWNNFKQSNILESSKRRKIGKNILEEQWPEFFQMWEKIQPRNKEAQTHTPNKPPRYFIIKLPQTKWWRKASLKQSEKN